MTDKPRIPGPLIEDARNKWDQLRAAAKESRIALPDETEFVDQAYSVFALSDFIAQASIRDPQILADLVLSNDLQRKYPPLTYSERLHAILTELRNPPPCGEKPSVRAESAIRSLISHLQPVLRRLRMREMMRIGWRDLTGRTDLA